MAPPPRIGNHRLIASAVLALLHGLLAVAYTVPGLARGTAPATGGNRISIVSYLDDLGPIWQVGFGATAAVLGIGLFTARSRVLAIGHTLCGAIGAVFATALWFGWALSDPRPSILTALGYTAIVAWNITISVTYAQHERPAPARAPRAAASVPAPAPPPEPAPAPQRTRAEIAEALVRRARERQS